jgi:ABC-2 type transport system permease protein
MSIVAQTGVLARRSIKHTFRQPAALIPSLLFPLLFMAVTTAGAAEIATLPGFPADRYIDFYVAGALVQGTLFGGIGAGTALAVDIEGGFMRRLLLTPLMRPAVLVAAGAGAMVVGAIQATTILVGGIIGGVRVQTGLLGGVVVIGLAMLAALAFSSVGSFIATWTGSSEATQVFFPFFFVMMIFSSYFMPRDFISAPWFKTVADFNPATYIIEAIRHPIITKTGWHFRPIAYGLIAVAAFATLGFGGAATALRTRLSRT